MLNVSGKGGKFQKHSTYSTYSTLQLKEAHFWRQGLEHIQHIQHYRRKEPFLEKMLLSAVMLNVGFLSGTWGVQKGFVSSKNIQHIQHIQHFRRKKHFLRKGFWTYSTYSTFPQKGSLFWKKRLLSAVMLNVGSPSGNWGLQKGSVSSKNIQHIQHIQHFRRKKHFWKRLWTYSTYSTFPQKEAHVLETIYNMFLTTVMFNVGSLSGNCGGGGGCGWVGCWGAKEAQEREREKERERERERER